MLPIFRDLNPLGAEEGVARVLENTSSVVPWPIQGRFHFTTSTPVLESPKLSEPQFPHMPNKIVYFFDHGDL